jgi:hypothetical protein
MAWEIFSKRRRRIRGEMPDIYVYDRLDGTLKIQIIHVMKDLLATGYLQAYDRDFSTLGNAMLIHVRDTLRKERGVFELLNRSSRTVGLDARAGDDPRFELFNYFLSEDDIEKALDVVELFFETAATLASSSSYYRAQEYFAKCAAELNIRFREAGVGYTFEGRHLIWVDSNIVHESIIKPALALLREERFSSVEEEYLAAHSHFRHGRHKECLVECLKSFESVMKIIASNRRWNYESNITAGGLIELLIKNELIPSMLQAQFTALRSCLESGIPTLRNKLAGHGQGGQVIVVPEYISSYMLNLTATNIVLLVKLDADCS